MCPLPPPRLAEGPLKGVRPAPEAKTIAAFRRNSGGAPPWMILRTIQPCSAGLREGPTCVLKPKWRTDPLRTYPIALVNRPANVQPWKSTAESSLLEWV
jgi:hypothetical protein